MIVTILVFIFVGVIAFHHYTQGLFSATISAFVAIIAASFALSLHETIVESLLAGKVATMAHGMMLLLLFAVFYMGLRVLFDMLVPGQIRLKPLIDKIGAALMGIVAGIYATGIVMIAMQEFPFGPTLLGYGRYDTKDTRSVVVPHGVRQAETVDIYDELKSDDPGGFDETQRHSLYVDDAVVNTVAWLSNGGSLAGSQPLSNIHPDLLQELFGQRLGIEPGGKTVALDLEKQHLHDVSVDGFYLIDGVIPADSEIPKFRTLPSIYTKGAALKPPSDSVMLVVRIMFSRSAADDDHLVRVSPGAIRLVAPANADGTQFTNYYPIGTLGARPTLYANKLDDFLFFDLRSAEQAGADFVFIVKKDGLAHGPAGDAQISPGVFLEVKRLGRVDLSGMKFMKTSGEPPAVLTGIMRKVAVVPPGPPAPPAPPAPATPPAESPPVTPPPSNGSTPPSTPPPAPATSLHSPQAIVGTATNGVLVDIKDAVASNELPIAIAVGKDAGHLSHDLPGGSCIPKGDKLLSINLDLQATTDALSAGDHPVKQLLAPDGQGLIIIQATASKNGWDWAAKADQFAVVDAAGNHYAANGAWAQVDQGGQKKFMAQYSANYPLNPLAHADGKPYSAADGTVSAVWLSFPVPAGTAVKQLLLGTDVIHEFPPVTPVVQ